MYTVQSTKSHGKLARSTNRRPPWRIALVANLKAEYKHKLDDPPDAGAEFDSRITIESIAKALEAEGHWVNFCLCDYTLPEALINIRPHFVFNIAEGLSGDGREAQVPALCELMEIPYTASRVVANAISLDKAQTKRIWRQMGLPTAEFAEVNSVEEAAALQMAFPLFVKPAREGTGMGIDGGAVVRNQDELLTRVDWVVNSYRQPALIETFLPGREFTVGFIGNPGSPTARRRPELYQADGYHWLPILEIDTRCSVSPGVYGNGAKSLDLDAEGAPAYLCPASIPSALQARLYDLTRRAAQALGVSDVARADFRLDANGEPHLLEINTLPGLNPEVSDLCIMADVEGLPYRTLISEILYLAAERYHMPFAQAHLSHVVESLRAFHGAVPGAQPSFFQLGD